LFDALAPILGIESITEADKQLMRARKEIDDRARSAAAILAKRQPDFTV
jgi:hypothetical protein